MDRHHTEETAIERDHVRKQDLPELDEAQPPSQSPHPHNGGNKKRIRAPADFYARLAKIPVRPHGIRESVLVKPETVYPTTAETHQQKQKRLRAIHQLQWYQKQFHERGREIPDWRKVLNLLAITTPLPVATGGGEGGIEVVRIGLPWSGGAEKYKFREGSRQVLEGIAKKSRCGVEFGDSDSGRGSNAVLSGTPNAVKDAVEQILLLDRTVTVTSVPDAGSGAEREIHNVPEYRLLGRRHSGGALVARDEDDQKRSRSHGNAKAHEIQQPEEWTEDALETYITDLITSRGPPPSRAGQVQDVVGHRRAVITQLQGVFADPAALAVATPRAFKMALWYMSSAGNTFQRDAKHLFHVIVNRGLDVDTEVFDILLYGAVKAKRLERFQAFILLMARRRLTPTLRTWMLFLRLVEAEEVRRYILYVMNTRGLLDRPGAMGYLAREMAEHDAYRAMQLGHDLDTFMSNQQTLYGQHWLSSRSGNKFLHVLGCYGKFDEMHRIIKLMFSSASARPDDVTLNTVITHCRLQGRIDEAVKFLVLFGEKQPGGRPSAAAYNELFELAYEKRRLHMLGVVFRYAHLHNATAYRMRRRAMELLRGKKKFVDDPEGRFLGMDQTRLLGFVREVLLCDVLVQKDRRQREGSSESLLAPGGNRDVAGQGDAADVSPCENREAGIGLGDITSVSPGLGPEADHDGTAIGSPGAQQADAIEINVNTILHQLADFYRDMRRGWKKKQPGVRPLSRMLEIATRKDEEMKSVAAQQGEEVDLTPIPLDLDVIAGSQAKREVDTDNPDDDGDAERIRRGRRQNAGGAGMGGVIIQKIPIDSSVGGPFIGVGSRKRESGNDSDGQTDVERERQNDGVMIQKIPVGPFRDPTRGGSSTMAMGSRC